MGKTYKDRNKDNDYRNDLKVKYLERYNDRNKKQTPLEYIKEHNEEWDDL